MREPTEFHIDNTFLVPGVGTVVSGTLIRGVVTMNQTLLLGPDSAGKFIPACIKGIHTNRLPVKMAKGTSKTASLSLSLSLSLCDLARSGILMTARRLHYNSWPIGIIGPEKDQAHANAQGPSDGRQGPEPDRRLGVQRRHLCNNSLHHDQL